MALLKFKIAANQPMPSNRIDYDPSGLVYQQPSLSFLIMPSKLARPPLEAFERPNAATNQSSLDPLAQHLEMIASLVLDALSDYNGLPSPLLEKHVAASIVIDQENVGRMISRAELLASRAEEMKHMPKYKFEIKNATTQIHEGRRTATMWTLKRLSGLQSRSLLDSLTSKIELRDGICKESVACTHWELRGKIWTCTRLSMVRGVAHGSNFES